MLNSIFLDFEFSRVTEEKVNLVSCCTYDYEKNIKTKWWLHNNPIEQSDLKRYLLCYDLIISYAAIAEGRSFISLGLDVTKFQWIDLFLEYRCLTNHNDKLQWGNQLVDGKVKKVFKPKPKWQRTEEDTATGFKATHSLAEATYKLLGIIRDTEHKDKMRDLIISDPKEFTAQEKEDILNYNMEDVETLPKMYFKMLEEYQSLDSLATGSRLHEEMKLRGKFSALTAIMESKGYPIDVEKTKNFSKQVGNIIYDCQREINELFPEIKPFKWDKKTNKFTWDQIKTREWIKSLPKNMVDSWQLTDTKNISLSLEAWQRFFDYKHDYPKDNFGAQMVRFLKLKQNLYGFVPSSGKDKKTFWDFVGSDGRVRPYTNIFGAQSGRSQPSSTGFMFLKPAWMRALVSPAPGKAMAGIDFASQEFFLSALLSNDKNMIDAYLSGDVYLAYAKQVGAIPADGTKETHGKLRDQFKSTILGLSYLMSKFGLAIKLSADTGRPWTEDEAQEQIDLFYEHYSGLREYQEDIQEGYSEQGFIKLPCGWYCWGDNENFRSVGNLPIQGLGGSVMRKSVEFAFERGLYVPFTLHDALYIEYDVGKEEQIQTLYDCMIEGFAYYFKGKTKELAKNIRLDPFAWSPNYQKDSQIVLKSGMKVDCSNLYIDPRAESDYNAFSKYFESSSIDLL